jgi:MFS family permease
MWYCRHEAQFRQALFFSAASVAGAFSGLLAFGIAKMDGVGNLEGWRWIFILEGILTVLVAIMAFFVLYDFPETAGFLTEEERAFVVYRLKYQGQSEDGSRMRVAQDDTFQWKYVKAAFLDWQIWANILVYWGIVCPLYGISLFLPTIIRGLGYTSSTAQLLTVPIYITASVLAVVVAYYSDRVGKRYPFILVCLCIMAVGFIMCIAGGSVPGVVYAGVFIAACALYPAFPGNITWLSNNLAGSTKRATGQALQIAIGNLAGGKIEYSTNPFMKMLTPASNGLQFLSRQRCTALSPGTCSRARLHRYWYYRFACDCVQLQADQCEPRATVGGECA